MPSKKCSQCNIEKDVFEFPSAKRGLHKVHSWCKLCHKEYTQKRRDKNKASYQPGMVSAAICSRCKRELPAEKFTIARDRPNGLGFYCRECYARKHLEWRMQILRHYTNGNLECACCGETHPEFLSIDHIEGGGRKQRAEIKKQGSLAFYIWLRNQRFPPGYQVLCHNCNQAKGFYGICPHQRIIKEN